ncbi:MULTISPECIES: AAA family ATPase [unclassified Myroides]|uniref:AAA family ATPase n=1 Tax=unclassified Myroides TaxID=2642485 RepID=UPI003D2F6BF6
MKPFYIFTGGPGSGKSSVLEVLASLGYSTVPEVGRAIIKQQIQQQGHALPWQNKQRFYERMLEQSIADYNKQEKDTLTFFDRGVLDSIGYAHLEELHVHPLHYTLAQTTSYAPIVFIFPPWEAIYQQDTERKQDFELATQTYRIMRTTYEKFGYQLVEVPCTTLEKRTAFILDYLHLKQ